VTIIAGESTRAAEMFADGSLEFVMLDDDHEYDSVLAGLQCWEKKIRKGGRIAGHDYGNRDFPGVAAAVDYYYGVAPLGKRCPHAPTCWWHTVT
jgi:cephalosporin hydroxylase